jgi:hypothetical protein
MGLNFSGGIRRSDPISIKSLASRIQHPTLLRISNTIISSAPQHFYTASLYSTDCVAIRHPGQVHLRTRAGIQKKSDYIDLLLDTGSRPPQADSSGMTGPANFEIVFKGRGVFCGARLLGAFRFLPLY